MSQKRFAVNAHRAVVLGLAKLGREIFTLPMGAWPGGVCQIVEHEPDPAAPEIVMTVEHATAPDPLGDNNPWRIGVFGHETVFLRCDEGMQSQEAADGGEGEG